MANLLDTAATWLRGKLQSHAATAIVYKRGAAEVELTATVSSTVFRYSDPNSGAVIRTVSRDFLIAVEDLVLGGEAVTPLRNDVIEETDDEGTLYSYTLLPINDEPFWKWLDKSRRIYRVHTKQTGVS